MENLDMIIPVLFAIHGVALAIVNFTPTPKPGANKVLDVTYQAIEFAAGFITKKAKESGDGKESDSTDS